MIQRGGVAGGEEGDSGGAGVGGIAGAGCCGVWKRLERPQERFVSLFGRKETLFGHDVDQLTGYGGSGVNETDTRACNSLKDREEERVMGTAEDNDVGTGLEQWTQAGPDGGFGFFSGKASGLYQFDKAPAYMLHYTDIVIDTALGVQIFGAFQRAGCGKDADGAGFRSEGGRLHGRLHADEPDRDALTVSVPLPTPIRHAEQFLRVSDWRFPGFGVYWSCCFV